MEFRSLIEAVLEEQDAVRPPDSSLEADAADFATRLLSKVGPEGFKSDGKFVFIKKD